MVLLKGQDLTFRYESRPIPILENISFQITPHSRVGIVGKNGSGKSTLVKILNGQLRLSSGLLETRKNLRIGYLSQSIKSDQGDSVLDFLWKTKPSLYQIKKKIEALKTNASVSDWSILEDFETAGGYEFEIAVESNMDQLDLDHSILKRELTTLSGGEKTKVGLLSLLVVQPDLLLLDEPTNHLDIDSLNEFKTFLRSSRLPYVIVSHDRQILDQCVSEIWAIHRGHLEIYSGNYSFYKEELERVQQKQWGEFERQQEKIHQLTEAAKKRRVEAERMQNFKYSRSVKKNGGICKRDEGSGSAKLDTTKKMRSAKALEKRIQVMIEKSEIKRPEIDKKRRIILPVTHLCSSQHVVRLKSIQLSFNKRSILSDLSLFIPPKERLAIVGPNGTGKTSLIKILTGELNPHSGNVRWSPTATTSVFHQESLDLDHRKSVLDEVWNPEINEEYFVRTVLGTLGIQKEQINQDIATLSEGEKVKVSLGKAILSGANTLILDEPTNHLEIDAREMLEQALKTYEGTVIFVSHDTYFVQAVATRVYQISNGCF